jgi:hypothetical protein
MRTDMHLMVEIQHENEAWKPLMESPQAIKCPRIYPMFAILADVRNSAGRFEKVWMEPHEHETEDGQKVTVPGHWYDMENGGFDKLKPIDTPRGVPDDATLEWQANVLIWQGRSNAVETTWLTPEEILAADWDQMLIHHGLVMESDYIEFLETGKTPNRHVAGGAGDGLRTVTEEEYADGERGEHMTLVDAQWAEGPVRDKIPGFLTMVEGMLEHKRDSTKVRFMLLFES